MSNIPKIQAVPKLSQAQKDSIFSMLDDLRKMVERDELSAFALAWDSGREGFTNWTGPTYLLTPLLVRIMHRMQCHLDESERST